MKTVLYMHNGSKNHGCEALVRTTTKIIKESINSDVVLWSGCANEDIEYGLLDVVDSIVSTDEVKKNSLGFLKSYFKFKILKQSDALHKQFIKNTFKNAISISIGGDNYCYPWSAKQCVDLDKEIRENCQKNILWGCSIEDQFMTKDVIEDLKGFDLVTVRESLSYDVLKKHGIKAKLVADPAFLLEKKELSMPNGFVEGNTVGINISPLINNYESGESIAYKNYVELVRYIINNTDMNVCLISHVVWSYNNDRTPMESLYSEFEDTNRVVALDDCNCEELKGYISRCRFFVGARTHATIAAYSSLVPTLVVGYSIKSKGIAKDIFGTYDNYVVPVQNMKHKNELVSSFKYLINNEESIKNELKVSIPKMKEMAESSKKLLVQLIGE